MKVVLDTNVLIAALVARGACTELLEHCVVEHEVVISDFILGELREKLRAKFGASRSEAAESARLIASHCTLVAPADLGERACRDPDDDAVLGTALAAGRACIVTGDGDLLVLKEYRAIRIVTPREFWALEAETEP